MARRSEVFKFHWELKHVFPMCYMKLQNHKGSRLSQTVEFLEASGGVKLFYCFKFVELFIITHPIMKIS